tara:strand:- start:183 stop:773 length:591 start_codon:yes stop_codon:yes gene_type:complete
MPKFNVINNPNYGQAEKAPNFRVVRQEGKETIKKFKNPKVLKTHFKSEVNIEDLLIFAPEEPEDQEAEEENEYLFETPNLEDLDEEDVENYEGRRTAMARIGKKLVVRGNDLEEWLREKDYDSIADAVEDYDGGSDDAFWVDKGGRYFYEQDLPENKNITDPVLLNAMKFWTKYHKNNNKFQTFSDIRDELQYWED